MPKVLVLGSESGIGGLRDVEELEQGSVKRRQVGGRAVACAGELERDERDGAQGFEEVVDDSGDRIAYVIALAPGERAHLEDVEFILVLYFAHARSIQNGRPNLA